MRLLHLLLLATALSTLLSCKDECEKFDSSGFYKCHKDQQLDSVSTASALLGRWRWQHALRCAWPTDDNGMDKKTYEGLVIEFRSDSTCVIHLPITNPYTMKWQLNRLSGDNEFEIAQSDRPAFEPHVALGGPVRFCNDQLWCNNSIVDGDDNFFVKE